MTAKASHKERTRSRILTEAASALRAQGAEGIGVAALMKRVGLTHGGFYAHFASRDDLLAHAIDRMFQDSDALLTHYLDGQEPAVGLAALIDFYLSDKALRAPGENCPLPTLVGEAARMPAEARARFVAGMTRFGDALAEALARLGRSDAKALGASAMAEMIGALAMARALPDDTEALRRLAAARTALKQRLGLAFTGEA